MSDLPRAARYLLPYVRLFPIWRHGARYDMDGRYVDDGWYPESYGQWEITREEAKRYYSAGPCGNIPSEPARHAHTARRHEQMGPQSNHAPRQP
jgi:hypothetical protein